MSDKLVVFYSRTGNTRQAAEALARVGGWDLAEIEDEATRAGRRGAFWSLIETVLGLEPQVQYHGPDPGSYDLVIVATPVWASSIASPVRSFLKQYRGRLKRVAFLSTFGGNGASAAQKRFAVFCGKPPLDAVALTTRDMQSGRYAEQVRMFASRLGGAVA